MGAASVRPSGAGPSHPSSVAPLGPSRRTLLRAAAAGLTAASLGATGSARGAQSQEAAPAPGTPAVAVDGDNPFPPETRLALEAVVDSALADTSTPGALVGVWYPGRGTWLKAAGLGDLATGAPVTLSDHVRIASNTKTFVGVVVLQLVDEGAVGLDDPLERYVPGVPNGDEITVRQVLGMTAGIYDFVNDPRVAVDYAADPLLPFTPDEALAIVRGSTPAYPPGERVQYSNSNYVLLGFLVEAVAGRPLAVEIAERIVEPLGLTETAFPDTAELACVALDEGVAHHYFFLAQRTRSGRVPIIVPRENRQVVATVSSRGEESVDVNGTRAQLYHLVVHPAGAGPQHVWVDALNRVIKVEIPDRGYLAVRTEIPR